ncbi:hypothetical protein AXG93_1544s1000 [Marchantia polymorpha subsp. ruderalis]|uniref:Uncharacterized protein n=1 Tax=Marchantia polymorpha subsp. ruderalis TaxID=1480154 RepID=A0A176VTB0_MARPO|nr:hypothetical protein AXG93_1544s1000 [Marchantia polymorpha subsp. ruderalis]
MVREWQRERHQPTRGFRPHVERWTVQDWGQVLGRCAGEEGDLMFECESVHLSKEEEITFGALFKNRKSSKTGEDGFLLFDSESVKVTKDEEISFAALFKSEKSSKNGYRTRDYKDRYRRNVAVALLQLLRPPRH